MEFRPDGNRWNQKDGQSGLIHDHAPGRSQSEGLGSTARGASLRRQENGLDVEVCDPMKFSLVVNQGSVDVLRIAAKPLRKTP